MFVLMAREPVTWGTDTNTDAKPRINWRLVAAHAELAAPTVSLALCWGIGWIVYQDSIMLLPASDAPFLRQSLLLFFGIMPALINLGAFVVLWRRRAKTRSEKNQTVLH